jgi:phosphonate transport system substrate-binding protein
MNHLRHAAAAFALVAALGVSPAFVAPAFAANAPDCPNGGEVRFGVEPYDTAAKLVPIYEHIGQLMAKKLNCEVKVFITTNYNAEIEAMRNGKLEGGQFGPLGYVLAHEVAKAEAVAGFAAKDGKLETYWASIVTYPNSGIKTLADIKGKSFAYSDPSSTSGHLLPAYGFRKAGIDPDNGFKALYAGSHTASFEALRNKKVDAAELNSQQIESATQRGSYKEGDVVFLWKSDALPLDPTTVRGNLEPEFKARFTQILQTLDLSELPADDLKIIGSSGARMAPQTDGAFDGIRDLVKTLNIDLTKLDS